MLEAEKQYIQEAKKGNKEAFGSLYDHYLPQIYRFILFKVNGKDEAEDLTHEVFLSAWKNMPSYRMKGFPFSSWLYQIARNAVIDSYRTNRHHVQIEMVDENNLQTIPSSQDEVNTILEMEKARKCISQLRTDYQDLIVMRFIEEMPNDEIAAALNKSEGAVRLMQHRAIKELKEIYENSNGKNIHEA